MVSSLACAALTCLLAGQVNLYEGPPFKFVKSMREHTKFANCARFSPDGALLCTVGSDMKVVIYDAASGEKKGAPTAVLLDAGRQVECLVEMTSGMRDGGFSKRDVGGGSWVRY